jgi:hypothetical protein
MNMRLRCFLFQLAFRRAHKAMKLGATFPITNLPVCYHSDEYDFKISMKCNHIIVGQRQYTYCFDDGEKVPYWKSWTVTDIDEFILKYHNNNIYGQFAVYPLILTQLLHGQLRDFLLKGNKAEFEEKQEKVRNLIAHLLDTHLKSFSHRVNCFLLALVK